MNCRNLKGFTLIEVIVVAAIISILAGILVPVIFRQIDQSMISRAQADVKSISTAIMAFKKDTGKWPNYSGGTYPCSSLNDGVLIYELKTEGNNPSIANGLDGINGWPMNAPVLMSTLLRDNPANGSPANSCYPVPTNATSPGWRGPYLSDSPADPWGNAYLVNVGDFETTDGVWVVSAGPDGIIQTGAGATVIGGDDIGIKIE